MRCDQPRPFEDLLGERARRRVMGAEQRQARPGVARWDAGEELEVVVEDHGMHRLRGDVDHARSRIAQADQQEEQPLLVEGGAREFSKLALVEGHRRNDHGRVAPVIAGRERAPDLSKAWLEQFECGKLLVERQVAGERRLWDHLSTDTRRARATIRRLWPDRGGMDVP